MNSDFKTQVLQATNIVELIGQSVALKQRGKDFVGLCPFHQEKSPSFHVSPARQFFHCFGCRTSGNAVDFVMKRDRLEFIEALKLLGQRAGIEMPRYGISKEKTGQRQLLLEAHSAACSFFEKQLSDPANGAAGREYLEKRGFTKEFIKQFQVGLAPNAWDTLLKSPLLKKFNPQDLQLAGLIKSRDNGPGHYDTFRNRLIFPIRDEVGRIIAFGGRVIPGSQDPAKYLNSPETPLFSKSRCVFGLDLARQRIAETGVVAVVEGYTDVVMAHQFGVTNVVSILGTAMTEQHVALLKRFANKIVLLFDADDAGDNAADKTINLFLSQDIEIAIAAMPDGLDPDEYLLQFGAESFQKVLSSATDALSHKWKQLSRGFMSNADDMTGQQKAVQEYLTTLSQARGSGPVDPLRWGSALARVSRLTGIPVDELHRQFRIKPGSKPVSGGSAQVVESRQPTRHQALSARQRAERWIIGSLLVEPSRWTKVRQHVNLEDFTDNSVRKLADAFWTHQRDEGEPVFNEFLGLLQDEVLTELAVELVEETEEFENLDALLQGSIDHLLSEKGRQNQQKLVAELHRRSVVQGVPGEGLDDVQLLRQIQEMKKVQNSPVTRG